MKRTQVSPSATYILDQFDDEFPDQYNALHEQARFSRGHKECDLAKIGRKLKTEPDFGETLKDPSRLMRRTSHAAPRGGAAMQPAIDRLRNDITRARSRTIAAEPALQQHAGGARASVAAHARAKSKIFGAQEKRMAHLRQFSRDHETKDLAYRIAFDKYDADDSGFIDADELHAALMHMGLLVDRGGSDKLLAKYDIDGNGQLDFGEFKAMSVDLLFQSDSDGLFVSKETMMRQLERADDARTSLAGLDLSFDAANRAKVACKPGEAINRPRRDPLRDRVSMLETMNMDREDVTVSRTRSGRGGKRVIRRRFNVKERRASLATEARLFRDVAETAQSGSVPAAVLGMLAGLERASLSGVRTPGDPTGTRRRSTLTMPSMSQRRPSTAAPRSTSRAAPERPGTAPAQPARAASRSARPRPSSSGP
ncbi:hypothetical protein JL722_13529 [Aureococcus anophagefferens]|nr:hypothetical protein JL722_13529 [Aureococcus anophagefferens]